MAQNQTENEIAAKSYKDIDLDQRFGRREQLYYQDMPNLFVQIEGLGETLAADILDLSVEGLALCHPSFSSDHIGRIITISLNEDRKYFLTGKISNFQVVHYSGVTRNRIGVKFQSRVLHLSQRHKRFQSPKGLEAMAYAKSPFRFNHTCHYRIQDFSANGLTLKGKNLSDLLVPGVIVDLNTLIPSYGTFKVEVEVTNIRKSKNDNEFFIGCTYKDPLIKYLTSISSYLLASEQSACSVSDLKENGFLISHIGEFTKFGYISNSNDWKSLLNLRRRSAQNEGRWLDCDDDLKMIDEYDKFARHLYCKLGNQIVAGLRITFNNGDYSRCEHSKYIEIPEFIKKDGFIEAARACTDPGYRRSNLFLMVLQNAARIGIQAECRYILMNCEDSLVKIYKRAGAKELNMSFTNEYMKGKRLNVLYFDMYSLINGKASNWLGWYFVLKDLFFHLKKRKVIKPSITDTMRVYAMVAFLKPIVLFLSNRQERKLKKARKLFLSSINSEKKGGSV